MIDEAPAPLSRAERKAAAKEEGKPFVPLAPPAIEDATLTKLHDEAKLLDELIESMNALQVGDARPTWFILGPYVFHVDGKVYYHNSLSNMDKWTELDEAASDAARKYLRDRMKLDSKENHA